MSDEMQQMMERAEMSSKKNTTARRAWAACVVCALVLAAQPAWAQGDKKKGGDEADAVEGPLQERLEVYWSVDRDLPVVKGKLYTREGRFAVGLYGGILPSQPFQSYVPLGGRLGYFFADTLGVEVSGQYELGLNTDLADYLEEDRQDGFDLTTDGGDLFKWRANAVVSWRPLYGKWALLQRKLSHFDVSFAAGVGVLGVDRPSPTRDASNAEVKVTGVIGAGFHFFIVDGLTLRLDWRSHPYMGPEFETEEFAEQTGLQRFEIPTEFQLGLSYMF